MTAIALQFVDILGYLALIGLGIAAANYGYILLAYFFTTPPTLPVQRPLTDQPHVLVQIPSFNEAAVIAGAAEAAVGLDWPREKLHVQILDDSTNGTTPIAHETVDRLRAAGHDITLLHRAHRIGFKAGALAAGLSQSDAPYVAVLDADFRAPAEWLHLVIPVLETEPNLAFVQSRCDYRNGETNQLTRVQRLMQDAHYVVEQAARYARDVPFQCNGTGTIWRRAAIEQVGGWSGETLAEDLDLGLRVFLNGWRARLLLFPAAIGELPEGVQDWQAQQNRWSSGFLQVARKLLPALWASDLRLEAKFSASSLILANLAFPGVVLGAVAVVAGMLLRGSVVAYLPVLMLVGGLALLLLIGMTWPAYQQLRRGSGGRYVMTLLSMPLLLLRLGFANARDIVWAALGAKRVFQVTPKRGH